MSVRTWLIVGAAVAFAGIAWAYSRRGESVVGSDPDNPDDDFDVVDELVDAGTDTADTGAPTADDIEGMGRMLASEAPSPNYTDDERVAIGWCAINWANHRKRTIASIMLPPHHQKGYWCSTFQSPSDADTTLATDILNGGMYSDPTNGAFAFFEPAEQDADAKTGAAGVTKNAAAIRAKWTGSKLTGGDGYTLLATIGRWEFYGVPS